MCSDSGAPQNKVSHCFHCFPIYLPWSDRNRCHDLHFFNIKPVFSLSSFISIKRLFSSSLLSTKKVMSSAYLRLLIFPHQSWFQLVLHPAWHFTWCILHIGYISKVTIYSLDVLLFQFKTSLFSPCLALTVASWSVFGVNLRETWVCPVIRASSHCIEHNVRKNFTMRASAWHIAVPGWPAFILQTFVFLHLYLQTLVFLHLSDIAV